MMTLALQTPTVPATPYAIGSDFCRIFNTQMSGLYQLSFLLTANPAIAEQCFVSGLEDCAGANRIFKEWAASWARRAIVQNAIRLIQPKQQQNVPVTPSVPNHGLEASSYPALLTEVLQLTVFERFVFVMSVLERHSDQDCKTMLRCSRRDIVRARAQALLKMASCGGNQEHGATPTAGDLLTAPRLLAQTA
jgi:hypothetical protein